MLLNIIEFGMNPQEAVEAPRFDTQHYVSSFDDHEFLPGSLNVESRVSLKTIQELSQKGHKVKVQGEWGTLSAPTVIIYDPKNRCGCGGRRSEAQSLRCRLVTNNILNKRSPPNETLYKKERVLAVVTLILVFATQGVASAPVLPNPVLYFHRSGVCSKPAASR